MLQIENLKSIHPFPARMAPSIVWEHLPSNKKKLKILDPMVGSGTTTTIARLLGHHAYGVDTDPLAVTIASAWSCNMNIEEVRRKALGVLKKAKKTLVVSNLIFPTNCDAETKRFMRYWFDLTNRRQLSALSSHIARVRNPVHRAIIWSAFSRMIITKSKGVSLAMDISHSRPHKVYSKAPFEAFNLFPTAVNEVLARTPFSEKESFGLPKAKFSVGDSRDLDFPNDFFDVIITSPPYLNAIDYFRSSKLTLVWMGKSINQIQKWRKDNIGSEIKGDDEVADHIKEAAKRMGALSKLPSREQGFAIRYLSDMDQVLKEISRVSKVGSKTIMVVGNSTLKDVYLSNSEGIIKLAQANNLKLIRKNKRAIPPNKRYLPSPSHFSSGKELKSRMRHEVVIEFSKIKQNLANQRVKAKAAQR